MLLPSSPLEPWVLRIIIPKYISIHVRLWAQWEVHISCFVPARGREMPSICSIWDIDAEAAPARSKYQSPRSHEKERAPNSLTTGPGPIEPTGTLGT